MRNFRIFAALCLCGILAFSGGDCEKNDSTFVATNEWKTVKKGQPIPSGLHVRHNFQTGVTEAKLMDKDDENRENIEDKKIKSLSLHSDAVLHDAANDLVLSIDELKARLKKIKLQAEEDELDEAKKPLRSYADLKKEFDALGLNISTDSEILTKLFEQFKAYEVPLNSGALTRMEADGVLGIFGELQFFLHQIDNAQLFADLGGMERIVSPCLNITNDDVKTEALIILGTAVQSNPKVQLKALNNDLVQKLLHTLTVNSKVLLQSRCMFALGALVRQFPAAQKVLIDHGGLEIFGKILEDGSQQIQLRVMKLITDLAVERETIRDTEDEGLRLRKIREYKKTGFEEKLVLHNYCKHLANFITTNEESAVDDDFLEIILENMIQLGGTCRAEFRDAENFLFNAINRLISHYGDFEGSRGDVEMYKNLSKQIVRLKTIIFDEHDEL